MKTFKLPPFSFCFLLLILNLNPGLSLTIYENSSLDVTRELGTVGVQIVKTRSTVTPFQVQLSGLFGQDVNLKLSKPESSIFSVGFTFGTRTVYKATLDPIEENIWVDRETQAVINLQSSAAGGNYKIEGIVRGMGIKWNEEIGQYYASRKIIPQNFDERPFRDAVQTNEEANSDVRENFEAPIMKSVSKASQVDVKADKAVIEILAIFDKTLADLLGNSEKNMTFYAAIFFHALNMLYESMDNPSLTVKLAGIRALTSEENGVIVEDSAQDIYKMLGQFRTWVDSKPSGVGPSDVATLLTGIDASSNVAGVAYISGTCGFNKVSVNEDRGAFWSGVSIVAHEVGHTMGAKHDSDTPCGEQGFIMGIPNKYSFSECSKTAIRDRINTTGGSCLLREDAGQGIGLGDQNPGDVHSFDEHCRVRILAWGFIPLPYRVEDNPPETACLVLTCRFNKAKYDRVVYIAKFKPLLDGTSCNLSGGKCRYGLCV